MDVKFNYGRTAAAAIIGVMAMAIGQPASAAEVTIDFENLPNAVDDFSTGNTTDQNTIEESFPLGAADQKVAVKIYKGQPLTHGGVDGSGSYGTVKSECSGCLGSVMIAFFVPGSTTKKPLDAVKLTIVNPTKTRRQYRVMINNKLSMNLMHFVEGGASLEVEVLKSAPAYGEAIWKITISEVSSSGWPFYVDNVKFDDLSGVASKLVEFRAFIPGDNAPTAPNVFCIALPEATSDGSVAAATVFRGSTESVTSATRRELVVIGDSREHAAGADSSHRVAQSVALIPSKKSNPDGFVDGSEKNEVADMELFAEDALRGRTISDSAMNDMDGGDCSEFHETRNLSAGRMKVNVSRPGGSQSSVSATFTGSVDTPFDISRSGKGAMDWNLTLTIDEDDKWELTGAHDGFPAYEIYVGGEMVYESNPGDGPGTTYTFGRDIRKLQGTMDVRVNESGTLD